MKKLNHSYQQNFQMQSRQQPNGHSDQMAYLNPLSNYIDHLSSLSLSALEKELLAVKQKQKQFYKLNHQLKLLEKKSKLISDESKKYLPRYEDQQDEQIAQLKAEIQGIIRDIKTLGEEEKIIKKQFKQSSSELKQLQHCLQTVKQNNYTILDEINCKKLKLYQKLCIVQELKDSQLENHYQIASLRQQTKSISFEAHLLEQQLSQIKIQKQNDRCNKQRLKKVVDDLEREINAQKDHQRESHYKLSHIKKIRNNLEEELLGLRKQDQALSRQYECKLEAYHKTCIEAKQSDLLVTNLIDEVFVVESDIQELNQQFISEGEKLKNEEVQNHEINQQFDHITKQALDVWRSICELIKIQEKQLNQQVEFFSLDKIQKFGPQLLETESKKNPNYGAVFEKNQMPEQKGMPDSYNSSIKFKSLRIWNQIQDIISKNSP